MYYKTIKIMEELRKDVSQEIRILFREWDSSEIEDIKDLILDDVCKDVVETSGYPDYNDSDIRIAIKRIILNNLQNFNELCRRREESGNC
jgi:hypothetical protein